MDSRCKACAQIEQRGRASVAHDLSVGCDRERSNGDKRRAARVAKDEMPGATDASSSRAKSSADADGSATSGSGDDGPGSGGGGGSSDSRGSGGGASSGGGSGGGRDGDLPASSQGVKGQTKPTGEE